ncbi:NINE protein [Maribrevibacterium harenarium]|uniref:NINE protein n=1 Tax=Maribrevibacterium harenarium TaxID=2589817 RepID=A0A501WY23_9GAMM|nr:NINE protein [Maribrevibacterium harenarium]TPE53420.1 NINE protein [Maribrevibacterium harenarium]
MSENRININVNIQGKSLIIAYLLWWFLGFLGIHRFYLGKTGTGMAMLLLFVIGSVTAFIGVGFILLYALGIWWLVDAILTYINTDAANQASATYSTINIERSVTDKLDELDKLHALYEKGALTKEEYERKKAQLMG